jgi:hypothetical protein
MGIYRAQVIIGMTSQIPADYVTNSWALVTDEVDPPWPAITAAFKTFYDNLALNFYPGQVAQNGHVIKYTELPGTPPNYPVEEATFNFATAPTGETLPSEVALVSSFQDIRRPGEVQARKRGRVYIGPLKTGTMTGGRPGVVSIGTLKTITRNLVVALEAIDSTGLGIWSGANQDFVLALNGWVDNAFDTQRRRGIESTARETWVL